MATGELNRSGMGTQQDPDKIPLFVVPCAVGFLVAGTVIGVLLANVFQLDLVPFLFRFAPLFTWACTFALALYLGRRPVKQAAPHTESSGGGFFWSDRSA